LQDFAHARDLETGKRQIRFREEAMRCKGAYLTNSYRAAFINGIAWNLLNMAIAFWLLRRAMQPRPPATRVAERA